MCDNGWSSLTTRPDGGWILTGPGTGFQPGSDRVPTGLDIGASEGEVLPQPFTPKIDSHFQGIRLNATSGSLVVAPLKLVLIR